MEVAEAAVAAEPAVVVEPEQWIRDLAARTRPSHRRLVSGPELQVEPDPSHSLCPDAVGL